MAVVFRTLDNLVGELVRSSELNPLISRRQCHQCSYYPEVVQRPGRKHECLGVTRYKHTPKTVLVYSRFCSCCPEHARSCEKVER